MKRRPPVAANPWVIAMLAIWLLGAAFVFTKAAGLEEPMPRPVRSAAR